MVGSVWIEGPTVEPLPYGLFSVAQMLDDPDPRFLFGARHEVDYCGEAFDSIGACYDFGTLAVTMNTTRQATLDLAGTPPEGEYTIDWGDDTVVTDTTPDGATHTYAANGAKVITVTGPRSYKAVANITVTNGAATGGQAALEAGIGKETVSGVDVVDAEGFAVLHLFECNPMGQGADALNERARRGLMLGEQRAVERVVARELARRADSVLLTNDVQHVVDGLAKLEKYAAANYAGVPTIHVTRDVGTLLADAGVIDRYNGRLETTQGARVASGGGYSPLAEPSPPNPDTGVFTPLEANPTDVEHMYVTGMVQVRRAAVIEANALQTTSNTYRALSERPYTVTWDCVTAAVPVATLKAGPA